MAGHPHPTDRLVDDLVATYANGTRRLEQAIRDGLRRGLDPSRVGTAGQVAGDATQAYRARQLAAANQILDQLRARGGAAGAARVRAAYGAAMVTTDRVIGRAGELAVTAGGRFGGIHEGAVAALAGNLDRSLTATATAARTNVADVFARAAAIDGPLAPGGDLARIGFLGRRVDDPWRKLTLEELGTGKVALETRRQITARLMDRLVAEGVADATTGFVDAAGRRWALDRYAEMVTRTTTREAVSAATANRLREHGLDLVTISSHAHAADECDAYDGGTFSLDGATPGYDVLDEEPPFHPNCAHVMTPGGTSDEEFNGELEAAIDEALGGPPRDRSSAAPPRPRPAPRPPAVPAPATVRPPSIPRGPDALGRPPLSPVAEATRAPESAVRLSEQEELDRLIAGDPGLTPDELIARDQWLEEEGAYRAALEAAESKTPAELVDQALGPDVVAALEDLAKSGFRDARTLEFRQAIVDGELSLEDAYEYAEQYLVELEGRRAERKRLEAARGYRKRPIPCFVCGRFKKMPADVCPHCGDDPLTHHSTSREIAEFNESYGYEPIGSRTDPTDTTNR